MTPRSQLVVDSLFARMLVRYGAAWTRMWEGIDIDAVKAEWAAELGHMPDYALRHGLDHMPIDRPPTVKQFGAVCARAPIPERPRLTEPKPTDEAKARARQIVADTKRRLAEGKLA